MTQNDERNHVPEDHIEELAEDLLRRLDVLCSGDLRGEISFAQYRVLSAVHRAGPLSIGRAARLLGLAQSTTSEMISRLLREGLISKVRGIYDGRVVTVEITDEGRLVLRRTRRRIRESYKQLYDRLSEDERGALLGALEDLVGLLRDAAD